MSNREVTQEEYNEYQLLQKLVPVLTKALQDEVDLTAGDIREIGRTHDRSRAALAKAMLYQIQK